MKNYDFGLRHDALREHRPHHMSRWWHHGHLRWHSHWRHVLLRRRHHLRNVHHVWRHHSICKRSKINICFDIFALKMLTWRRHIHIDVRRWNHLWAGRQFFDTRWHPSHVIVVPLLLLSGFVAVTVVVLGIEWFVDNVEWRRRHCHRHIEFTLRSTVFATFSGHHLYYIFLCRCICSTQNECRLVEQKVINVNAGKNQRW